MTAILHFSAVLLLLFMCFRPVQGFGRRGSSSVSRVDPIADKERWSWSSTGVRGLDHSEKKDEEESKMMERVVAVKRKSRRRPDSTLLEHHPYASGVFTLDPSKTGQEN